MKTGFKDQPQWFTGVVEDINDPSEMGRVKVRCFGYHTPLKDIEEGGIPTENLPWSHVMMPVNNASMSGIGQSATGILQGSWVIGFFRDGEALQDPFIIGTLPSMSTQLPAINSGFSDPEGKYPLSDRLEESDLSPSCRVGYDDEFPYINKEDLRQEGVETAVPPRVTSIQPDKEDAHYERKTWESRKLEDIIEPSYPKNHVYESESGHLLEVDDTPGFERLSRFHKSGTHEEIVANGDRSVTIIGDDYEVCIKNKNILIKGDLNLTVEGSMRTLVKKDYHLEVEGDKTEYVKGNRKSKIGINELVEIDEESLVNIAKNSTSFVGGSHKDDVSGDRTINITGNYNSTVVGNSQSKVNGDVGNTVLGATTSNGGGAISMIGSGKIVMSTSDTIEISTDGSNKDIVITAGLGSSTGNVDINGSEIHLN